MSYRDGVVETRVSRKPRGGRARFRARVRARRGLHARSSRVRIQSRTWGHDQRGRHVDRDGHRGAFVGGSPRPPTVPAAPTTSVGARHRAPRRGKAPAGRTRAYTSPSARDFLARVRAIAERASTVSRGRRGRGFVPGQEDSRRSRFAGPEPASRVLRSAAPPPTRRRSSPSTIASASRPCSRTVPDSEVGGRDEGGRDARVCWATPRWRRDGRRIAVDEIAARRRRMGWVANAAARARASRRRRRRRTSTRGARGDGGGGDVEVAIENRRRGRDGGGGALRPGGSSRKSSRGSSRGARLAETKDRGENVKVHGSLGFEHQRSDRDRPRNRPRNRLRNRPAKSFRAPPARLYSSARYLDEDAEDAEDADAEDAPSREDGSYAAPERSARSPTRPEGYPEHARTSSSRFLWSLVGRRAAAELNDGTSAYRGGRSRADGRAEVFEVDEETSAVEGDDDDPVEGDDDPVEGDDDRFGGRRSRGRRERGNGGATATASRISTTATGRGSGRGSNRGWDSERNSARVPDSARRRRLRTRTRVCGIPRLATPRRRSVPPRVLPGILSDAARRETPIPGAAPPRRDARRSFEHSPRTS